MNDTISRQAAIDVIASMEAVGHFPYATIGRLDALLALNRLPSAERNGRWEHSWGDEWCCSACGHVITTEGSWERPWQKYCEECGAKMMREDEEMSKVSEMEMAYAEYLND